jgi:hypothetical protein
MNIICFVSGLKFSILHYQKMHQLTKALAIFLFAINKILIVFCHFFLTIMNFVFIAQILSDTTFSLLMRDRGVQ